MFTTPSTMTSNPHFTHTATAIQLFRYSAVTWNPHLIHYDTEYAKREGHPGLLVHSHLRSALALRALDEWADAPYRVTNFVYRLRKPATPGTKLNYTTTVVSREGRTVSLRIEETLPDGAIGFEGDATVELEEESS